MKYSNPIFVGIYYILACFSLQVNAYLYTLDEATDKGSEWKIKGSPPYIEKGNNLRESFSEYFPHDFEFGGLDSATGVWVIVPIPKRCSPFSESGELKSAESSWVGAGFANLLGANSEATTNTTDDADETTTTARSTQKKPTTKTPICYKGSDATFKFSLRSQLIDSVAIRYCFGGNAVIHVGGSRGSRSSITMSADGQKLENWVEETVTPGGSSMSLEASVSGEGDYILIDRINVHFLDNTPRPRPVPVHTIATTTESSSTSTSPSPTTMTPPNPTTSSPEPAPASGQGRPGLALNTMMLLFAIVFLISLIFNQM